MLIEEALYQLLSNNAPIVDMVGKEIHPVTIPQRQKGETTYPVLLYTLENRPRTQTHDGPDGLVRSQFTLDCLSPKYIDAKRLADKVRLAINGKSQALADIYGMHVRGVFLQDERDAYVYDEVDELQLNDIELSLLIQHREALT